MRNRLTFANICSSLALLIALGTGGAYAANTIGSTDIINGQVRSLDIGNNQVQSIDVRDDGLTGTDITDSSLNHLDVALDGLTGQEINESLTGSEILDESLNGEEIADHSLKDDDIAEGVFHFTGTVGTVSADHCVALPVTGVNAAGDHLVLTPSIENGDNRLIYSALYRTAQQEMRLSVCNFTSAAINDGTTDFNLLVIDAH